MTQTIRIAMWSGPRNISTAMMRSFSARSDCAVSDEPFYGAFLKASKEPHPMAAPFGLDRFRSGALVDEAAAAAVAH